MSEQPTQGRYWTLVDISSSGCTKTYERQLPHGTLVRVATHYPTGSAVSVVFVPHPPRLGTLVQRDAGEMLSRAKGA